MATLPVQLDEKALIAEQIAALPLPEGIRFLRVEDYEDWTGEPSYRAYFATPAGDWPSKQEIADLIQVHEMVHRVGFELELQKFVFFKVESESPGR